MKIQKSENNFADFISGFVWHVERTKKMIKLIIYILVCAFPCMGYNDKEKSFDITLLESDLSNIMPLETQRRMIEHVENWTGVMLELKKNIRHKSSDHILLVEIKDKRNKKYFYKIKLEREFIINLLKEKAGLDFYTHYFDAFGRRPDYLGNLLRYTWHLALIDNTNNISEFLIIDGYFLGRKLVGFRIYSSKKADEL